MRNLTIALVAVAAVAFLSGTAQSETIYYDDFDGASTDPLAGTTPDTDNYDGGSNTWVDTTDSWDADGIKRLSASNATAALPFSPDADGGVYTLSADPNMTSSGWIAMGFISGDNLDFMESGNPWMLVGGEIQTLTGKGIGGTVQHGSYTEGDYPVSIELDTTSATWEAEWYVEGGSIRTGTVPSNTINRVGFMTFCPNSSGGESSGAVDNFTLIPEPATLALIALGGIGVLLRRRRA